MSGKLDLARARMQGPEALERYRRRKCRQKRRQRARRRAAGLTGAGKPLKDAALQARLLVLHGHHPDDCICYDCLWRRDDRGATTAPTVHRIGSAS